MALPQRLSFVTLGARSVASLRDFYRSWGWTEEIGGSDAFACFVVGTTMLALYPIELLQAEAAPDAEPPAAGTWNGVTLAINLADPIEVDHAVAEAAAAGAVLISAPVDREWGGYSGYVADPESNRWELAWAPGLDPH